MKYYLEDEKGTKVEGKADYIAGFFVIDGEISAFSGGKVTEDQVSEGIGHIQDLIHTMKK